MIWKALILLSFSFFGNVEVEGVLLNGYANGVISLASDMLGENEIRFVQYRLFKENTDDVSIASFLNVLFSGEVKPAFKIGIAISFWNRKEWIGSLYFTGAMSGIR